MTQERIVGAVEIGTSKVAVLIGEIFGDSSLRIVGHSACSSKGVRKGMITDLDGASDCVHAAIMAAEKQAGAQIDEVYLAQTGSHLEGTFNVGVANVSSPDGVVRSEDVERAKDEAKRRSLSENRTYIHHIQSPFKLDGRPIENPVAREGDRLEVGYWSVHGDKATVSDNLRIIKGIDLEVSDVIISSIASGAVLLEDAEKEAGALVIDLGGGTSDYVLYREGYIVRTGVLPVGGDHITNDLSIGLRVGRKSAEELKVKNGRAFYESGDRSETVWLYGDLTIGDRNYPLAAVTKIIEARVTETFQIIRDQLEAHDLFHPDRMAAGVVLTGGGSRLEGIADVAEKVLGLPTRIAEGPRGIAEELRKPEYSTCLGLLHYALTGQDPTGESDQQSGFLRRLTGLLNFG